VRILERLVAVPNLNIKKRLHGIKGFVIPTKSLVKKGITKIFCYNNKMLFLSTKRLVAAAKFLVAATKNCMLSLILLR